MDPGAEKITLASGLRLGIVLNLGSFAFIALAGLALNLAIGRVYGPAALGEFNLVLALFTVAAQFSVLGMQFAVLRRVAIAAHVERADARELGQIICNALTVVVLSSVFFAVVMILLAPFFGWMFDNRNVRLGIWLIAPGLLFYSLNKTLLAALNALDRLGSFATMQALRYVLIIVFLCIWVVLGWDAATLPALFTCSETALTCIMLPMVARWARPMRPHLRSQSSRELFVFGLKAMWGGAAIEVNARVDILVLGVFVAPAAVGVYSIAALIYEGLLQLPLVLRNVINARLAVLAHPARQRELTAFLRPIKRGSTIMMIMVALISILVFPTFAELILVDPAFRDAWLPLSILVVGLAASAAYLPLDMVLSQGGQPWMQSVQKAVVVGANFALNVALVPFLGNTGSALGTALSNVVGAVLTFAIARRYLKLRI